MLSDDLDFLYGLYREGIKLDLSMTKEFSRRLGNPEDSFKSFHIAGTNGKGSTSAYIYNTLMRKYSTGLYTSPHLIRFNERIIARREPITDNEISDFINENRELVADLSKENRNPTFFEATTIMAFKYFASKGVDYASVEVGLGGRLDSTNILTPEVSIITQVGYEHADKLGCSLTSIAMEKAGIIKPGVPVVLGDSKKEVVDTVRKQAEARGSDFLHVPKLASITGLQQDLNGSRFLLTTPKKEYNITTGLIGKFQPINIATAVIALENSGVPGITKREVEAGIKNTKWPGRMDIIRKDPIVMVDGAHNPPAANALKLSIKELDIKSPLLLVGMLSDKDSFSFLRIMREISDRIVFTSPGEPTRDVKPEKLKDVSSSIFKNSKVIEDPIDAYNYAVENSEFVLVTGSLYLVGAIMKHQNSPVMPFYRD